MKIGDLAPKEAVLLGMLQQEGPMTGADLVLSNPDEVKAGSVYVLLKRLSRKGYVVSEAMDDDPTPGPPRRFYEVSESGAEALDIFRRIRAAISWATAEAEPEDEEDGELTY